MFEPASEVIFDEDVERVEVGEAAAGLGAATSSAGLEVEVLQQQAALETSSA